MNESLSRARDLIATNRTESAIEILKGLSGNNAEISNQLISLSARFKDISRKERLGLVAQSEASIIRAQVNYGVLDLINDFEKNGFAFHDKPQEKKVFISYNHKDADVANALSKKLEDEHILVIMDSQRMQAGDDIQQFIEKSIRDTDATLSIISKASLLSAWVAMESINTLYHEKTNSNKKFIGCFVEDDFFQRQFTDDAFNHIEVQLQEIDKLKKARAEAGRNTRDLNNEYTRLKELMNSIDEIIRRLRESLCVDIRGEKLELNFPKILASIQP